MLLIEGHASDDIAGWKYNRLAPAPLSSNWNDSAQPEAKVHRIHAYPARFPSFLVHKALEYAAQQGLEVKRVADVFNGSGTVTCAAAARNIASWGCDLNPVANLIARVKASRVDLASFQDRAIQIIRGAETAPTTAPLSEIAVKRLSPWYRPEQFEALAKLRNAVASEVGGEGAEAEAFALAFSAIVKTTSQWRTRSAKPANDPEKRPMAVSEAFLAQCRRMIAAWNDEPERRNGPAPEVVLGDIKTVVGPARPVDLIVTSPPYATSYDYADLHQLSALWLGFADDHRAMSNDFIGTTRRRADLNRAVRDLNTVGLQVAFSLFERDRATAETLAAYFLDMQAVARRCHDFLRPGGMAVFVVGNTRLGGVRVDCANHLVESLLEASFEDVRVVRRHVGMKANTPFRSADGRLTSSRTAPQVYAEEYVVMAQRP